jgi:hypothetical protein
MSVVTRCPALAVYEIFVPFMVIVCCVIAALSVVSVIESSFPDPYGVVSRSG